MPMHCESSSDTWFTDKSLVVCAASTFFSTHSYSSAPRPFWFKGLKA